AVLILGDSVAFGSGVEEPKTFVGFLRRSMPNVRFYNSSVIGYGLHDYANVVDQFIPLKPEIKYVLLFYCLNYVYQLNATQAVQADAVTPKPDRFGQNLDGAGEKPHPQQADEAGQEAFTSLQSAVYSINVYLRSRSKLYLFVKNTLTDPSMRYFKQDLAGYQK